MTFATTVSRDFLIDDGNESVTFTVQRATLASYTVLAAGADLTQSEITSSGGYFQSGDRRWCIGRSQIPGVIPQRGDKLTTASAEVWEVIDGATLDPFGISWEVMTRRAR